MTSSGHQLVEEYLRRFDNASVFLTAERRIELRQEIVEHIDAGLEEADALHAHAARTVLERLGPAADIVAAELSQKSTGSTPVIRQPAASANESEPGPDGSRRPRPDDVGAPIPRVRPRKAVVLLTGAAATVAVAGMLAFGASTSSGDPGRGVGPSFTPSESAPPTSEVSPGSSLTPPSRPGTRPPTP